MKTQQGFDIYNGDISRSKAADRVRSCPIKHIQDLWIYQRSRSKNKTQLQPIQRRHWEKFAESSSIKHKLWRLYINFPDENAHRVASYKRSPQSGILYIYVTDLQRKTTLQMFTEIHYYIKHRHQTGSNLTFIRNWNRIPLNFIQAGIACLILECINK